MEWERDPKRYVLYPLPFSIMIRGVCVCANESLAFQTAVALAEYEANKDGAEIVTLKDRHLKSVVKMSKSFKEYLRSTHKNQDSSKRARMFEWRNDNFGKQES